PVERRETVLAGHDVEKREVRANEDRALTESGEDTTSFGERGGVDIEADELAGAAGAFQDGLRVAADSDRAIEKAATFAGMEVRGDGEAPLRVRIRFMCSCKDEVPEARRLGIGARALRDVGVEGDPFGFGEDREALPTAHPTGHDRSFFEPQTELRRDGEAALVVE